VIDSHCHLDFDAFDIDRHTVLAQCQALGIKRIVIPGTQASTWHALIALCDIYPQLHFALGIHPYFLDNFVNAHLLALDELLLAHKSRVVAVGEIGLDYSLHTSEKIQMHICVEQLQLAQQHQLPVIVHHRRSHNALIRTLKQQKFEQGGIIHAFSGSLYEAQSYIELGFKLGVGGTITYPRAQKTRKAISQVPLTSLVLETDAPDMPINNKQGERNNPHYLPLILRELQALRAEPADEVQYACLHNTLDILANLSSNTVQSIND
tara:strand:+ start:3804 stop:4598 length:795 start_codon:yes stop_codon:yes gene_type:complete